MPSPLSLIHIFSTLQRTSQTARILFPEAKLVPVDGLKEMCFGSFEGRNFIEMEKDLSLIHILMQEWQN